MSKNDYRCPLYSHFTLNRKHPPLDISPPPQNTPSCCPHSLHPIAQPKRLLQPSVGFEILHKLCWFFTYFFCRVRNSLQTMLVLRLFLVFSSLFQLLWVLWVKDLTSSIAHDCYFYDYFQVINSKEA